MTKRGEGLTKADRAQAAREKRDACNEWKLRVGCKRCDTRKGRLVFHHPASPLTRRGIADLCSGSWNALVDEIAVCEVLCDLCHMGGHHGTDKA